MDADELMQTSPCIDEFGLTKVLNALAVSAYPCDELPMATYLLVSLLVIERRPSVAVDGISPDRPTVVAVVAVPELRMRKGEPKTFAWYWTMPPACVKLKMSPLESVSTLPR